MSFFSRTVYPNGGAGTYALTFPYIDPSHVTVLDNGLPYMGVVTFPSPSTVHLSPDIVLAHSVTLKRVTPEGALLVTFQPGSLSSADLNLADTQLLYIEQEFADKVTAGEIGAGGGGGGGGAVTSVNSRTGAVLLTAGDVTTGLGALVGSFLAPGSGITLNTSAGVTTITNSAPGGGGGGAVSSVAGRTGAVTLTAADVSSGFGTAVGAALAAGAGISMATALGVTTLTAAVASVAGRTGAVTLAASDISGFGAAVGAALAAGPNIVLSTVAGVTTITGSLGGGPAGSAITLDPANTGSNLAYSSDHLTVIHATANGYSTARSTTSVTTGKFYFEVHGLDFGATGDIGAGVFRTGFVQSGNYPGNVAHSVGARGNGFVTNDGTNVISGASDLTFSGGVLCVAYDADNSLVWFKKAGGVNWNNNSSASPSSGAGGIILSGAGAVFAGVTNFAVTGVTSPETTTVNFGATSFLGTPPLGFTTWDGNAIPGAGGLGSGVTSVNGRTGAVSLAASDVATGLGAAVGALLAAGTGISLATSGGVTTITNTAPGGGGGGGAALDLSNTTILAASAAQTLPLPAIINRDLTLLKFIPSALHAAIESHTSTVDVTAYIQAALDEANTRGGARVLVEEGLYKISTTLLIASGTHLQGKGMASKIQTIAGVWTPFAGDPIFNHSLFMNRNFGESIIDADIMFSDLWISGDRANQAHHLVNMRGVDRVRMNRVRVSDTGGSATAFLTCRDTLIENCFANNCQNAGFDHWDAVENCHVVNSTVREIYGQGIQFTATATPAAARSTFSCSAKGNYVFHCVDLGGISADPGWAQGITFNSSDPSATSFNWWGKSIGNHIENCSTGLNFSGKGGMHKSEGDFIRNCTFSPVHIGDELGSGTDAPDYCQIDNMTLSDCAYDAAHRDGLISVEGGQQHTIRGLKVTGVTTTFAHHVGLAAATSKCHVFPIETDHASTGASVNDLGTANKLVTFTGF